MLESHARGVSVWSVSVPRAAAGPAAARLRRRAGPRVCGVSVYSLRLSRLGLAPAAGTWSWIVARVRQELQA